MIVPIRCFSCGKLVAHVYEEFMKRTEKGEKAEEVLDNLGVIRYCCRRTLFSHVDLLEDIMKYKT